MLIDFIILPQFNVNLDLKQIWNDFSSIWFYCNFRVKVAFPKYFLFKFFGIKFEVLSQYFEEINFCNYAEFKHLLHTL